MCIWSNIFLKLWKRKNNHLARIWNVEKFEANEEETVQFIRKKNYLKKKLENKTNFIKYIYSLEKSFKSLVSIFILCFMVIIATFISKSRNN